MFRSALKLTVHWLCVVIVFPLFATYWLIRRTTGTDGVFQTMSQLLCLIPGLMGSYLRVAFYRLSLDHCSPECHVGFGALLASRHCKIGRNVYLGPYCTLGKVELAEDVLLGSNVDIFGGGHSHHFDRLDVPVREQGGEETWTTVGQDTWIGNGAIVMAPVGKKCVIGAGSVVTKPIDDFSVAVGNPARTIRKRGAPAARCA